jgi:hypothetical protein
LKDNNNEVETLPTTQEEIDEEEKPKTIDQSYSQEDIHQNTDQEGQEEKDSKISIQSDQDSSIEIEMNNMNETLKPQTSSSSIDEQFESISDLTKSPSRETVAATDSDQKSSSGSHGSRGSKSKSKSHSNLKKERDSLKRSPSEDHDKEEKRDSYPRRDRMLSRKHHRSKSTTNMTLVKKDIPVAIHTDVSSTPQPLPPAVSIPAKLKKTSSTSMLNSPKLTSRWSEYEQRWLSPTVQQDPLHELHSFPDNEITIVREPKKRRTIISEVPVFNFFFIQLI